MTKPSADSVELTLDILEAGSPLLEHVAVLVGRVQELNHAAAVDAFEQHREKFEAAGAAELLDALQAEIEGLFLSFFNKEK